MARTDTLSHFLTDVANAIRTKGGTSDPIQASSFDTAIANLPSGGGGLNMDSMFTQNNIVDVYFNNSNPIAVSSMNGTFQDCTDLHSVDFTGLDTTGCTNFNECFYGCYTLAEANINTDSAETMYNMFSGCSALGDSYVSLSDTSNVTDMTGMFAECSSLIDVSGWTLDTSSVETANEMFSGCASLTEIPVFDMSNATSLTNMFAWDENLSTTALDNILQMCIGVGSNYTGAKTLVELGLDENTYAQATIEALDHYADFINAGWSTGYGGGE